MYVEQLWEKGWFLLSDKSSKTLNKSEYDDAGRSSVRRWTRDKDPDDDGHRLRWGDAYITGIGAEAREGRGQRAAARRPPSLVSELRASSASRQSFPTLDAAPDASFYVGPGIGSSPEVPPTLVSFSPLIFSPPCLLVLKVRLLVLKFNLSPKLTLYFSSPPHHPPCRKHRVRSSLLSRIDSHP